MSDERKPGFTCPNCGSNYFGTYTHHKLMGDKHEHGARIGACHGYQYDGRACRFEWDRSDEETENKVIRYLTREEWVKQISEIKAGLNDLDEFISHYERTHNGV